MLDPTDLRILELIQSDARITNADLSRSVKLSPSACLRRVQALEQAGYMRAYVTLLAPDLLGLEVSVFIQVSLERKDLQSLKCFENSISKWSEVVECYLMTGDSDYLIRVVVSSVSAFERFLVEQLTKIPGIAMIKSSFALKQIKYTTNLPLESADL